MRQGLMPVVGVCVAVCLMAGCAARGVPVESYRPGPPRGEDGAPADPARASDHAAGHQDTAMPAGPAEEPARAAQLEAQDPELRDALAALAQGESGARHRRAAAAYGRAGVLDAAHRHWTQALDLDRTDAAAYEGLARIWRDWGFPAQGLGAAYRAVSFAPTSATAHNTLGTLLQALGQVEAARQAYTQALALDEGAVYALNNLCSLSLLDGALAEARAHCQAALRLNRRLDAARYNLALVWAAEGCIRCARLELAQIDDAAAAHYALGIVLLGQQDYAGAAHAFDVAAALRPGWSVASTRARQARAQAARVKN